MAKANVDIYSKVWTKVEAALETICLGFYPLGYHVKREDRHRLSKNLTYYLFESPECSFVPEREVIERNSLSEAHAFAHHPTTRVERSEQLGIRADVSGGLLKVCKFLNPIAGKLGFDLKKGHKEEQKFERVALPPGGTLKHQEGQKHSSYRVRVNVQGDLPIRVSRHLFFRNRDSTTILAQEVLRKLPDFSLDDDANVASCTVTVNTTSLDEIADVFQ